VFFERLDRLDMLVTDMSDTTPLEPSSSGPGLSFDQEPRPSSVSTATAIMESRDVALGFGVATIMEDITVSFPKGTITALVGPSGSGKTTFLRSLNRMNDKVRGFWKRGEILLEGEEIDGAHVDPLVLKRRVGMVFQRPNPFPMSIQDNVVAGVRAHKMAKRSDYKDIAETYLAQVGLWARISDRLNDSPFRLSGGQQQLLCLARALAVEPAVLLLDEPTSSLDPRSTEAVEEMVHRLTPELTVIIVTHNLAQARRLSDNTIFFYEGHLIETGPTADLFEHPQRIETARYLGAEDGPGKAN
jgi:phosphate transport system ATP-binding protein